MKPLHERTLTLNEQTALEFIADHPRCSNRRLADHLRLTVRGAEELVKRLRNAGYLSTRGRGRARRLQVSFPAEHHTECAVVESEKANTRCGDQIAQPVGEDRVGRVRPELPLDAQYEQTMRVVDDLALERNYHPSFIYHELESLIARVESELSDGPVRKAILESVIQRRDWYFAAQYCLRELPNKHHRQANLILNHASPGQLAQFRERVTAAQLTANVPRLLAECFAPPAKTVSASTPSVQPGHLHHESET